MDFRTHSLSLIAATSAILFLLPQSQAGTIWVDLNEASPNNDPKWNTVASPSDPASLLDSEGNGTGFTLSISGFSDSSNTGHKGAFSGTTWDEASNDYFFIGDGSTGTITISGLSDSETYTLRLIGSVANQTSARLGDFQVNGSFGDGSSPSNGDDYNMHNDGFDNGTVMVWSDVTPSSGVITITMDDPSGLQTTDGSAHLNAFSIEQSSGTDPNDPVGPNVLWIIIDDLNTWIEPTGEYPDVKTPEMTRLAAEGTTFTQAFCQGPACGPSRASFISGLRPSTTGLYGQSATLGGHPSYAPGIHKTIFESFKDAGYTTAITGKIFHQTSHRNNLPSGTLDYNGGGLDFGPYPPSKLSDPALSGGNRVIDWGVFPENDSQLPDYQRVDQALGWMPTLKSGSKPFFMAVGLVRPHVPQFAPQSWWDEYPLGTFQLPYVDLRDLDDTPRFARYLHWNINGPRTAALLQFNELENFTRSYLACVSFVDSQVGRLLDGLEANGLKEDTIVVLMSDHGYHLGEKGLTAKLTLWDRATRMPMIVAGPGIAAGQKSAQAVELLDVYPTLLDLCGLPAYAPLEGQTLRPILEDAENAPARRPAITTMSPNNHAVSDGRYRYIRYADGTEEFYDRAIDPDEATNRIDHPNFREIVARLAAYLPTVNVANSGGNSRVVTIGSDGVVRWEGNAIRDPLFNQPRAELSGAGWLWSSDTTSVGEEVNYFRKKVTINDIDFVDMAVLTATADAELSLWINGTEVLTNADWTELSVLNVTAYLQTGENTLEAQVSNTGTANPAGLLASLYFYYATETEGTIPTDASWKVATSVSGDAWRSTEFDDSAWANAVVVDTYDNGPWSGVLNEGPSGPVTRETPGTPIADEPIVDTDEDGIPDFWEIEVGGSLSVFSGSGNDQDKDGVSDLDEYTLGFDASDAHSVPRLALSIVDENSLMLHYGTALGRDYFIRSSVDLSEWNIASDLIPGNGSEKSSELSYDPVSTPRRFYNFGTAN